MTINQEVRKAFEPLNMPVVPAPYTGAEERYIAFQAFSNPTEYGDDNPISEVYRLYIELFLPLKQNSTEIVEKMKRLCFKAGFGWPSVVPAHTDDKQHFVFECETNRDINF